MKRILLFFFVLTVGSILYAQTRTIYGCIVDQNDEPIIGATIQVKGTQNAVASNLDGCFTIHVKVPCTLIISYIGMRSVEVPISDNVSAIKIILRENTEVLSDDTRGGNRTYRVEVIYL